MKDNLNIKAEKLSSLIERFSHYTLLVGDEQKGDLIEVYFYNPNPEDLTDYTVNDNESIYLTRAEAEELNPLFTNKEIKRLIRLGFNELKTEWAILDSGEAHEEYDCVTTEKDPSGWENWFQFEWNSLHLEDALELEWDKLDANTKEYYRSEKIIELCDDFNPILTKLNKGETFEKMYGDEFQLLIENGECVKTIFFFDTSKGESVIVATKSE